MDSEVLLKRTKNFALSVIKYCQNMPKGIESTILLKQLMRSGTSVAANYRAACRARSDNEFYAKLCIVVEESDECVFWLELIQESGISDTTEMKSLKKKQRSFFIFFLHPGKQLNNDYLAKNDFTIIGQNKPSNN